MTQKPGYVVHYIEEPEYVVYYDHYRDRILIAIVYDFSGYLMDERDNVLVRTTVRHKLKNTYMIEDIIRLGTL